MIFRKNLNPKDIQKMEQGVFILPCPIMKNQNYLSAML